MFHELSFKYFMWYFKQKHFQSIIWYSVLFCSLRWRDLLLINIQIEKIHLPTILHCDFTSAGERATFLYQDRLEIILIWPSLLSLFCQCMPWEKSLISRDMQLLLISAKWLAKVSTFNKTSDMEVRMNTA